MKKKTKTNEKKNRKDLENFIKTLAKAGGDLVFKGGGVVVFAIIEGVPMVVKMFNQKPKEKPIKTTKNK